ncbi:unnamed protein product [Amoebophrya sp. A120]|nr:unnamed protein product [Amoebophrya sp. A120]|eukprot:GSA120T00007414001.1
MPPAPERVETEDVSPPISPQSSISREISGSFGISPRAANVFRRRATLIHETRAQKSWVDWCRYKGREKIERFLESDRYMQTFMLACVFLSTVTFCWETMEDYQERYKLYWKSMELVFVTIFTIEYLARLTVTSKPYREFLLTPLNILDVVSVVPTWVSLLAEDGYWIHDQRIFRIFRLFWVFKFGRHSTEMNYIVTGMIESRTSFLLLSTFLVLALVFFSYLMFSVERGEWDEARGCFARADEPHYSGCSPYADVPTAIYWAITTVTTVGYGDTYPITAWGKLVTGACMVCGIFCVACPTTVLGVEFGNLFNLTKLEARRKVARGEMVNMTKEELELIGLLKKLGKARGSMEKKVMLIRQILQKDVSTSQTTSSRRKGSSEIDNHAAKLLSSDSAEVMDQYEDFLCRTVENGRIESALRVALDKD